MTVSCKKVFRARNRCIKVTETTENSDMIQVKRGKTCHRKARMKSAWNPDWTHKNLKELENLWNFRETTENYGHALEIENFFNDFYSVRTCNNIMFMRLELPTGETTKTCFALDVMRCLSNILQTTYFKLPWNSCRYYPSHRPVLLTTEMRKNSFHSVFRAAAYKWKIFLSIWNLIEKLRLYKPHLTNTGIYNYIIIVPP